MYFFSSSKYSTIINFNTIKLTTKYITQNKSNKKTTLFLMIDNVVF